MDDMASPESIKAFVLAAELGSFSAAARRMNKAQSAVSTAIANLEIDTGTPLFDRSKRNPVLTVEGEALLPHAKGILLGHQEFMAKALSMAEGIEDHFCMAVEQGIGLRPLMAVVERFGIKFPHVPLEILTPGPNDTAQLLIEGRADIGLMTEKESYPTGFQFRGIGHSKLMPVCAKDHPLAALSQAGFRDLRQYRQLIPRSRSLETVGQIGERKSPTVWYAEDPWLIVDLVVRGLGWAELPVAVIGEQIRAGSIVPIAYGFQQSDILHGIDVVWTERRALGTAGHWVLEQLFDLPQRVWQESGA